MLQIFANNFANILDRPHSQTFCREIFCSHTLYIHNVMQRWQAVRDTHASMEDCVLGVINALKHNRASEVIDI